MPPLCLPTHCCTDRRLFFFRSRRTPHVCFLPPPPIGCLPSSIGDNALVSFNWLRPDDNGGSPIINYQLFIDNGLGSSSFTQYSSSTHEQQVLTVKTATPFTVRFRNAVSASISMSAGTPMTDAALSAILTAAGSMGTVVAERTSTALAFPHTYTLHFLTVPGDLESVELSVGSTEAAVAQAPLFGGAGTPEVQRFQLGDGSQSLGAVTFQLQETDPSTNTVKVTANIVPTATASAVGAAITAALGATVTVVKVVDTSLGANPVNVYYIVFNTRHLDPPVVLLPRVTAGVAPTSITRLQVCVCGFRPFSAFCRGWYARRIREASLAASVPVHRLHPPPPLHVAASPPPPP